MGLPSVTVLFKEAAETTANRAEHGVVGLILKDTVPDTNPVVVSTQADIPGTLSADNQDQIRLALLGYAEDQRTRKVEAYIIPKASESVDYTDALEFMLSSDVDFLAIPSIAEDNKTEEVVNWLKSEREENNLSTIQLVLPDTNSDYVGVINYATDSVTDINGKTYTAEKYCARIAGLVASVPLNASATFCTLPELAACEHKKRSEVSAAIDAGKFIVFWDGEKVKVARGVNSLTSKTDGKSDVWKKIRVVKTMDLIEYDIRRMAEDNYIGKYENTYDNKTLLVTAINAYFEKMITEGALESGKCELDLDANRAWLKKNKYAVADMSDYEIKTALTGTEVYLKATVKIVEAMEDITVNIAI